MSTVSIATKKTLKSNQDTIWNSQYDHLRVIDMRTNKTDNGFIITSLLARMTSAPDKPLGEALSGYFDSHVSAPLAHNELVLLLYHFKVEFIKGSSGYSYIHFDGDFYRREGDNYVYLGNTNRFIDKSSSERRLLVVAQGILQFTFMEPLNTLSNKTDSTRYSMQGMMDRRNDIKHRYPIYNTKQFKKGIYLTVDQFLNNEPLDTPITPVYFSQDEKVNHFKYYYTEKDGSPGSRIYESDYFAIYDGDRWVVADYNFGTEMQYINNDFYTVLMLTAGSGNVALGRKLGMSDKKLKHHVARYMARYECVFDPSVKAFRKFTRMRQ